jgi:hypothetical protein
MPNLTPLSLDSTANDWGGSVTDLAVEIRQKAKIYTVNLYSKPRDVCAYDTVLMLRTLNCPVRVVCVFRSTQ